jgi:hypothetical protein
LLAYKSNSAGAKLLWAAPQEKIHESHTPKRIPSSRSTEMNLRSVSRLMTRDFQQPVALNSFVENNFFS